MILDGYLGGGPERKGGFARACTTSQTGWYGLDLFAGTGINWSEMRGDFIDGSPLIALKAQPPFATKVIAAEKHNGCFAALLDRTVQYGDRVALFNVDANTAIGRLLDHVPKNAPAFAFLDPEGSELDWRTVEAIAAHKKAARYKVEQLVLFPTDTGFLRLAPDYPEKVDRIFGHGGWREIWDRRQNGTITVDMARTMYVQLYAEGFRKLGYETVLDRQIKKSTGHSMYFLIFATDNDAGKKIMDSVFDKVEIRVREELGQGVLFPSGKSKRVSRLP